MALKELYLWRKKLYQFMTNLFFQANIPTPGFYVHKYKYILHKSAYVIYIYIINYLFYIIYIIFIIYYMLLYIVCYFIFHFCQNHDSTSSCMLLCQPYD